MFRVLRTPAHPTTATVCCCGCCRRCAAAARQPLPSIIPGQFVVALRHNVTDLHSLLER
jgi:hypothetical protein